MNRYRLLPLVLMFGPAALAGTPSKPPALAFEHKSLALPPLSLRDLTSQLRDRPSFGFRNDVQRAPRLRRPELQQRPSSPQGTMPVLRPDEAIDYKMVVVPPDPTIDFKMAVVRPGVDLPEPEKRE